jgi:hypothetical protein
MRCLALCYLFLLSSYVIANESILPKGCQAVAVQGDTITVKTKKNSLVFIHNLSTADLWITHPVEEAGASAGWTSRLQSSNWSALSLEKGSFALNCIESRPGHEQQIPCEGAIAVCTWKRAKLPSKAQGNFWAAEDLSLSGLIAAVGARGFVIP